MGELTASSDRIRASSGFASGKASDMESGIDSFSAAVDAFLSGGWQGQAPEAYRPPFEDWVANARKVQQALETMAELLASAAGDYDQREGSNKDLLHNAQVNRVEVNL